MIYDKIENLTRYGFDLLFVNEILSAGEYSKGKFVIESDNKFGIGLEYQTKDSSEALWEAHRRYLDIHCLLEGEEIIELNDISQMTSTNDYEDDYQLFEGYLSQKIVLTPGYFLLLFPNEVHKTSVKVHNPIAVKKIVFKLKINE